MELYLGHGFEQTTVAEIAERAGLTERTFFRHFADKREVLFGGASLLQELIVKTVIRAPEAATPIEAVAGALEAAGTVFQKHVKERQRVINSDVELQARELSKLATLASAIEGALHQRGVAGPVASLTAEAGIVVFKTAFERWLDEPNQREWPQLVRATLDDFKAVMVDG